MDNNLNIRLAINKILLENFFPELLTEDAFVLPENFIKSRNELLELIKTIKGEDNGKT